MKKDIIINPEDLMQQILHIMAKQIEKLAQIEELTESQIKILPAILRVVLATKIDKQDDLREDKANLALLSTKELEEMLEKEKEEKKK